MLVRNSIGRCVSLLNDDSNTTTSNSSKRSTSTSVLPSISTFYCKDKPNPPHQLPLRSYQQQSASYSGGSSSSTNDQFSRKSSWATATSPSSCSSSQSTNSADFSPALSQKSLIESSSAETAASSNGRNSRTLYSPDSGYSRNHQQPTTASTTAAAAVHQSSSSSSSHQRQSNSGVSSIPHRPAGPTPLLLKQQTNSSVYHRGNSSSGGGSSSSTTTTSSSKGSSSYSVSTSNSSNSTNSLYSLSSNQSAKSHHSLSSSSSASRSSYNTTTTTPLTPPTPVYTESNRHMLDPMDTHKSSAYGSTVLSSPTSTRDPFLYPASLTGNSYPLMNGYNLSVAQQPLPPPITASSPVMMYSTMDSPTSATSLMDPYLQQQQVPNIPFAPYPNELIPGALPPASTQSVAATSPSDTSNNSAPKTAKKKYPCPHAAKYNCSDTFTTSGHAARHGKKHTGEKNIHCPVCDKAFTRKDNMKQHERTHRNKGEASKVAQDVETSKRAQALSKTTTNSSTEVEMEDSPPMAKTNSDPQTAVRAAQQQRRPQISPAQQAPPSLTSPTAADIPMPVTLDSGETLQRVAPSFKVESMNNIFDNSFTSRSQENILGRPAIFERTTSTGSGFSADGEGESPGLDALAMAAELS